MANHQHKDERDYLLLPGDRVLLSKDGRKGTIKRNDLLSGYTVQLDDGSEVFGVQDSELINQPWETTRDR